MSYCYDHTRPCLMLNSFLCWLSTPTHVCFLVFSWLTLFRAIFVSAIPFEPFYDCDWRGCSGLFCTKDWMERDEISTEEDYVPSNFTFIEHRNRINT